MGFQRIYICQRRPTLRTYPKQQNISMSGSHKMNLRQRFTSFTMGEPKAYRASRESFNTIPSYPARKANPSLSTPILTGLIDGLFYRGIVPTNINMAASSHRSTKRVIPLTQPITDPLQ